MAENKNGWRRYFMNCVFRNGISFVFRMEFHYILKQNISSTFGFLTKHFVTACYMNKAIYHLICLICSSETNVSKSLWNMSRVIGYIYINVRKYQDFDHFDLSTKMSEAPDVFQDCQLSGFGYCTINPIPCTAKPRIHNDA